MTVPVSQMATVLRYVLEQKIRGNERYPLVLMLEPLLRCNLSCAGCGKIQYPSRVLKHQLSVEECLAASDECRAPVVSIAGGEPLLHPQIREIVQGLVERGRYVYLCTNALLLEERLDLFQPDPHLTFSVHLDGLEAEHDHAVCRKGTYEKATRAIRAALQRGFRVTTNTTLFEGVDPERTRAFFDEAMALGVEGMMLSPGYSYEKAPDQEHFLRRERTRSLFRRIFRDGANRWRFNQSPLFLEFLVGARDYDCTPWGNPTYTVFGWQKPCYLLQEGYADSFQELLESTEWGRYGHASGNPRCQDCMVHSGFEASAVNEAFSSFRGFLAMARATLFGPRVPEEGPAEAAPAEATPFQEPVSRGEVREGCDDGALRAAFSYRGDVTLHLADGSQIEGFVVDVREDHLRLWQKGSVETRRVPRQQVRRVAFTGRDPAAAGMSAAAR